MAQPLLRYIIDAMRHSDLTLRTLKGVKPRLTHSGEVCFCSGRRSIIFDVETPSGRYALKCYTSSPKGAEQLFNTIPSLHSSRIVAPQLFPRELMVSGPTFEGYIDLLLAPWSEGTTLDYALRRAAFNHDTYTLGALADEFARLALDILSSSWRHGDLKPDNIIVDSSGTMTLIDLDALYHPTLPPRGEVGSPGFVHPLRGESYNSHIDDYSIALICVILNALVLKPDLLQRHPSAPLLINPVEAIRGNCKALAEVEALFAHSPALLALTRTLAQPKPNIEPLTQLIKCIAQTSHDNKKEL